MERWDAINIGVAIALDDGLIAPALLDCRDRGIADLAAGLGDLVTRTRAGKLRAPEIGEGTFTLSNLGMFDVTAFTAIITPPQVAILATARTVERPVVRDGEVVIRRVMTATLSSDHRVVDGVGAAGFLGTLKTLIEAPGRLGGGDGMTLLAGAAEVDITPPFPVDLLGYVRRPLAARSAYESLMATACVFRDDADGTTVVVIAADVVGLTTPMADRIRARVGELVGCDPAAVLLNSSHTHAAPWPGATIKLGGEFDDWTETELRYWDSIPDRYASAALEAVGRLAPARVSGGVGEAKGIAVNRRERTADGRTILGWNRDGVRDDSVVAIRVDGFEDAPLVTDAIATLVSFACHPVVIGPDYPGAGPDFVGPLAVAPSTTLLRPGSVTVFLQGAAGDALPLEAFRDDDGAAAWRPRTFGERLALEAAPRGRRRRIPWAVEIDRSDWGSVTPISLYRRRLADEQPPQALRTARRIVSLPLLELPSVADLERELEERRADLVARADRGRDADHDEPDPLSHLVAGDDARPGGGRRSRDRHRWRDLGGAHRRLRHRRCAGRDLRGDRDRRPRPVARARHDLRRLQPGQPGLCRHARRVPLRRVRAVRSRIVATASRRRSRRRSPGSSSGPRSSCCASCSRDLGPHVIRSTRPRVGDRRRRPRADRPARASSPTGVPTCRCATGASRRT